MATRKKTSNITLDFMNYYKKYKEPILQHLLSERLKINSTWDDVSVETDGRKLYVKWSHRKINIPKGHTTFKEHSVPFNMLAVTEEILRQEEKYLEDVKKWSGKKSKK